MIWFAVGCIAGSFIGTFFMGVFSIGAYDKGFKDGRGEYE